MHLLRRRLARCRRAGDAVGRRAGGAARAACRSLRAVASSADPELVYRRLIERDIPRAPLTKRELSGRRSDGGRTVLFPDRAVAGFERLRFGLPADTAEKRRVAGQGGSEEGVIGSEPIENRNRFLIGSLGLSVAAGLRVEVTQASLHDPDFGLPGAGRPGVDSQRALQENLGFAKLPGAA